MSTILMLDMTQGRPARRPRTPFGERLAKARECAGLTQVQLAQRLGTTQGNITSWEREVVALRPDQLKELANALDVSADYLLGRITKPPTHKGPAGKMRRLFEEASRLPRSRQQRILVILEDMLAAQKTS